MPNERDQLAQEIVRNHMADQQSMGTDLIDLRNSGAMEQRGYLDPNGEATELGEEFLTLLDEGIFDNHGKLTPKGEAFAMDRETSLLPQNLDAYILRQQAELDDSEVSFGQAVGGVFDYLGKAIKGAGSLAWRQSKNPILFVGPEKDEAWIEATSFLEGAVEGPAQLGSGMFAGVRKGLAKMTGNERAYWDARQSHDRFTQDVQDYRATQYAAHLFEADKVAKMVEERDAEAIAAVGPERAQELIDRGTAAGEIFGDPANYLTMGVGAAVGATEKLPLLVRLSQKAERVMVAQADLAAVTARAAKASEILEKTQQAAAIASRQADNLANMGRDAGRMTDFAKKMGLRAGMEADDLAQAEALIASKSDEVAKLVRDNQVPMMVERIRQGVKQAKSIPPKAVGDAMERVGNMLIKADDGLREIAEKYGMDSVSKLLHSPLTMAGGFAVGGPIGTAVGATTAALASGKMLKAMGNFSRVLGDELMMARGTVPFWQRVANNSHLSPLGRATAHLMDTATLGRRGQSLMRVAKDTAKGTAAAYPIDLAFEVMANGGELDENTLKQALAESLVFGGTGAAVGSIVHGSSRQLMAQQAGDEANFRSMLAPEQVPAWSSMPSQARRSVAAYSAAFPALKIELTETGNSHFHRESNTAVINVKSGNWIEPLIAHEVGHYVTLKGQMEDGIKAMLVGTPETGGLLRSKDGTMSPEFAAFSEAYNARMEQQGHPALSVDDLAVEYFVDSMTQDLIGRVESGDLAKRAGASAGERVVREIMRTMGAKMPIVSDFVFRSGTALDKGGRVVPGTGLASLRTVPGAKRMLDAFLDENAGRRAGEKLGSSENPVQLPYREVASGPLAEQFHSYFQTDAAGNIVRDAKGHAIPIDRQTDMRRQAAGLAAIEIQKAKIDRGEMLPAGEFAPQENGTWQGTHLSAGAIRALEEAGVLNKKQIASLRQLNRASKSGKGETFFVINQPATIKRPGKRAAYGTLPATFREIVPVGVSITKDGNILVHLMSTTQLVENIRKRAKSDRGKRLYNGDEVAIREDVEAVGELHRQNRKTDGYFEEKYGAVEATERKNFINSVFGLMTAAQKAVNPLFDADNVGYKDGVYKTYRIDRINRTVRMQGVPAMPFRYESVKMNLLPEPVPMINQEGE